MHCSFDLIGISEDDCSKRMECPLPPSLPNFLSAPSPPLCLFSVAFCRPKHRCSDTFQCTHTKE